MPLNAENRKKGHNGMTIVKICGITTLEDAIIASEEGADLLGFNFYPKSPRYIEPIVASEISASLRARYGKHSPILVGVFVNATLTELETIMANVALDAAQLSGDESSDYMKALKVPAFKAIRPPTIIFVDKYITQFAGNWPVLSTLPSMLVDAFHPNLYGGTGETTSSEIALYLKAHIPRMMLAGGLTPTNIAERIAQIEPWGVDVASGVEGETIGRKSPQKVRAFIQSAKR